MYICGGKIQNKREIKSISCLSLIFALYYLGDGKIKAKWTASRIKKMETNML